MLAWHLSWQLSEYVSFEHARQFGPLCPGSQSSMTVTGVVVGGPVVGAGVVLLVVGAGVVLLVVGACVVLLVVGDGVVLLVVGAGVVLVVVGDGVVLEELEVFICSIGSYTMIGGSRIVAGGRPRSPSSRLRFSTVISSKIDPPGGASMEISRAIPPASRRLPATASTERMRTLVGSTPAAAEIAPRTLSCTEGVNSSMLRARLIFILSTGAVPSEGAGVVLENTTAAACAPRAHPARRTRSPPLRR